mmetsp:Transcript_15136/g.30748  ORF Transcript_15136/g.30748 Transcript_15136/m.30748 type:complete len:143 (+) Transcript_15136:853-1281(+)
MKPKTPWKITLDPRRETRNVDQTSRKQKMILHKTFLPCHPTKWSMMSTLSWFHRTNDRGRICVVEMRFGEWCLPMESKRCPSIAIRGSLPMALLIQSSVQESVSIPSRHGITAISVLHHIFNNHSPSLSKVSTSGLLFVVMR